MRPSSAGPAGRGAGRAGRRKGTALAAVTIIAVLLVAAGAGWWWHRSATVGHPRPAAPSSHNLAPVASNQWYSNVFAQFPTEPLYALPAAFQLRPDGLGVSLPTVTKSPTAIQAPYRTDLLVGLDTPLRKPRVESIGDWSISLSMSAANGNEIRFVLAHGVPFTVLHSTASTLLFNCAAACDAFVDNTRKLTVGETALARTLVLVIGDHSYLLAPDRSASMRFSGTALQVDGPGRVFLAVLDSRAHYELFRGITGAEVWDTRAAPEVVGDQLRTTYSLRTTGAIPLVALYPHQAQFLSTPLPALGAYATVRGTLALVRASSFTTVLPLQRPAATFPPLRSAPSEVDAALRSDIDTYVAAGPPASRDYQLGVWLGRGANLLLLAQGVELADQRERLLRYLEPVLATSLSDFVYDTGQTSVLAKHPEFGNEKLNDHHFHYGYYIRTAAVLAQADTGYLAQVRAPIDSLVSDIANRDRSSQRFPYLRNFDVYEGHSWADGFARFADGNDEESSSEAVNAWYALYLWSQVTQDPELGSLALYLYTTEIQSVKEYWFGIDGLYTPPYQHRIASIVWGGKVEFATWFSGNANAIYGIQLLPVTPGSSYLGGLPQIRSYLADLQASGGSVIGYWADLVLVWLSYYAPQQALDGSRNLSGAELNGPRSLMLYMLAQNAQSHAS